MIQMMIEMKIKMAMKIIKIYEDNDANADIHVHRRGMKTQIDQDEENGDKGADENETSELSKIIGVAIQ